MAHCADSANALQSLGRGINILTVDPSLYSTMITSGAPFLFSDPTLANCVSGQNAIDAQNVYELYTSSSATEIGSIHFRLSMPLASRPPRIRFSSDAALSSPSALVSTLRI